MALKENPSNFPRNTSTNPTSRGGRPDGTGGKLAEGDGSSSTHVKSSASTNKEKRGGRADVSSVDPNRHISKISGSGGAKSVTNISAGRVKNI